MEESGPVNMESSESTATDSYLPLPENRSITEEEEEGMEQNAHSVEEMNASRHLKDKVERMSHHNQEPSGQSKSAFQNIVDSLDAESNDSRNSGRLRESPVKESFGSHSSPTSEITSAGSSDNKAKRKRRRDDKPPGPKVSGEDSKLADVAPTLAVRVEVLVPKKLVGEAFTIQVKAKNATWGNICTHLERSLPRGFDKRQAVAVQLGRLYHRGLEVRRAVRTWDPDSEQDCYRSEFDGSRVDVAAMTHHIQEILIFKSPVRTCPGHMPLLTVLRSCKVLRMSERYPPRLMDTNIMSLLSPKYLVLMTGLMAINYHSNTSQTFVQLADGDFCDVKTGEVFPDNEAVVSAWAKTSGDERWDWCHLLLLLRNRDGLPRWNIVDNRSVYACARHGIVVEVEDGAVFWADGVNLSENGEWTQPRSVGCLQKDLTSGLKR